MRIFGKLVLAFVAVSALTCVSALVGMLGIQRVQDAFKDISDGSVPELAFLGRLEASAATMQTEALSIALLAREAQQAGGKTNINPAEAEQLQEASHLFDRLMTQTLSMRRQDGKSVTELEQLRQVKAELLQLSQALVAAAQHSRDAVTMTELLEAIETAEAAFRRGLGAYMDIELQELEARQAATSRAVTMAMVLSVAVALLSLGVAVMLGLILARHVAQPLQRLSRAARSLGEGVQDARVQVESRDEIGQLGQAFNDMADKLVATTISRDDLAKEVRERQWAEIQALEAKSQADAANAAKGQFLANMSHEIRTPLNAIIGFSELLADTPLNERQERYVKTIRSSGTGLLAIVNDVLDLSKIEANQRVLESVSFDLKALVGEVLAISSANLPPSGSVALRHECAGDVPAWFQGDPTAVRQILLNLVSNAIKFTQQGRVTVLLDAEGVTEGGKHMVRVRVRDTGIGIPPGKIDQIFQVFTQADASTTRQFGGTGLGLAITRSLAELMGGSIECHSTEGEGSEFVVRWPLLSVEPPAKTAVAVPVAPAVSNRPLRLLVAEDNAVNQMLARGMLDKLGHQADVVENGQLAVAQVSSQPYDMVLMDLHMPVMGGLDAARAIRQSHPALPIIALTAAALSEDRQQSLEAGMNDFLTKPLQISDLEATLKKWMVRP